MEVAELLKRGHLQEFLTDKGKQTFTQHDEKQQTNIYNSPLELPRQDRVLNYITGGSEVSGVSYSTTKRHTWQVSNAEIQPDREHPSKIDETIIFSSTNKSYLFSLHHDALVISLHIVNCLTIFFLINNSMRRLYNWFYLKHALPNENFDWKMICLCFRSKLNLDWLFN